MCTGEAGSDTCDPSDARDGIVGRDFAGIRNLTARFQVKRRLGKRDEPLLPGREFVDRLLLFTPQPHDWNALNRCRGVAFEIVTDTKVVIFERQREFVAFLAAEGTLCPRFVALSLH